MLLKQCGVLVMARQDTLWAVLWWYKGVEMALMPCDRGTLHVLSKPPGVRACTRALLHDVRVYVYVVVMCDRGGCLENRRWCSDGW